MHNSLRCASMLYKFKSKATGDLIMLQPDGRRVLQIIGKVRPEESDAAAAKGILSPEEMTAAIGALLEAVAHEEVARKAAHDKALSHGETPPRSEAISLRRRSRPFVDMLRRAQTAGEPVVWGV